jgi:hypothetical protein
MNKRGDACICIHRFLTILKYAPYRMWYEDGLCQAKRTNDVIMAYAYEISNGTKYIIGECMMRLW